MKTWARGIPATRGAHAGADHADAPERPLLARRQLSLSTSTESAPRHAASRSSARAPRGRARACGARPARGAARARAARRRRGRAPCRRARRAARDAGSAARSSPSGAAPPARRSRGDGRSRTARPCGRGRRAGCRTATARSCARRARGRGSRSRSSGAANHSPRRPGDAHDLQPAGRDERGERRGQAPVAAAQEVRAHVAGARRRRASAPRAAPPRARPSSSSRSAARRRRRPPAGSARRRPTAARSPIRPRDADAAGDPQQVQHPPDRLARGDLVGPPAVAPRLGGAVLEVAGAQRPALAQLGDAAPRRTRALAGRNARARSARGAGASQPRAHRPAVQRQVGGRDERGLVRPGVEQQPLLVGGALERLVAQRAQPREQHEQRAARDGADGVELQAADPLRHGRDRVGAAPRPRGAARRRAPARAGPAAARARARPCGARAVRCPRPAGTRS